MAVCSLFLICDYVDAAPRTAVRSAPASRKSTTTQAPKTTTNTHPEFAGANSHGKKSACYGVTP